MFPTFGVRLVSTAALRFSYSLPRAASFNALARNVFSSQSRPFLTSTRLQISAKSSASEKKSSAKSKTSKTKSVAKKSAKKVTKKAAPKKKPSKRVVAKPIFNRKLMTPPKRPMSAYFVFNAERFRSAGIKSIDDAKTVAKETSEAWKSMSEAERQVYVEKSVLSRADYLKAYEAWYKSLPPGYFLEINKRRVAKGKRKLHKPTTLPKGPSPPWIAFMNDYREKHGKTGVFTTYVQDVVAEWNVLPESAKEAYRRRYRDEREEYLKKMRQE